MPELPEVETIVVGLKRKLAGLTIAGVEIFRRSILGNTDPEELCRLLVGERVEDVLRRGKFIVFQIGRGRLGRLVTHLRMTGKYLFFNADDYKELTHVRMVLHLDNQTHLVYQDVRCLGTIDFYRRQIPITPLVQLGPEPLSDQFTPAVLAEILGKTAREIKSVLMDQHKLAGIGNIYASEILFHSRINPTKPSNKFSLSNIDALHSAITGVLQHSIDLHGTTFSDYRDVDDQKGRFQDFLCVYQRAEQPCRACSQPIKKITQQGRSTFFCPHCQPA